MKTLHTFFKKHTFIAILTVFIAEFLIYEGLYRIGAALHFSFDKPNKAYLIVVIPLIIINNAINILPIKSIKGIKYDAIITNNTTND